MHCLHIQDCTLIITPTTVTQTHASIISMALWCESVGLGIVRMKYLQKI